MSIQSLLARASRKTLHGRALRRTASRDLSAGVRARLRGRRDPSKLASSDAVWHLVEQMMMGDGNAAIVLSDLIGGGLTAGHTRFERITRKAWKLHGHAHPAVVQAGAFAAVTPNRQIVLFGIKREYRRSDPPAGVMRGYLRRFKIGDIAEYAAFNLVSLGKITAISAKRITVARGGESSYRKAFFDVETFNSKNYDLDVAAAIKRNQEWSD
jgi:hypothetical protein